MIGLNDNPPPPYPFTLVGSNQKGALQVNHRTTQIYPIALFKNPSFGRRVLVLQMTKFSKVIATAWRMKNRMVEAGRRPMTM